MDKYDGNLICYISCLMGTIDDDLDNSAVDSAPNVLVTSMVLIGLNHPHEDWPIQFRLVIS